MRIWKDVVGFEGYYSISNQGNLRSDRFGRLLKPKVDKDGYHEYCLSVEGTRTYRRCHRLVAEAFIPNKEKLPLINHIDSNKINNIPSNLEWCTVLHNNMHHIKNNLGLNTLSSKSELELNYIIQYYIDSDKSINGVIKALKLECSHEDLRRLLRGESFISLIGLKHSVIKQNDYSIAEEILKLKFIDNIPNGKIAKSLGVLDGYVSRIVNRKRLPEIYDKFMEERSEKETKHTTAS